MQALLGGRPVASARAAFRCAAIVFGLVSGLALDASPSLAREAPTATPTPGGPYYTPPAGQNISGVWRVQRYDAKIAPVGGGELPFTAAGREQYQMNMAGLKDGTMKDEARRICVPDGLPRILGNPYPFEIVQTLGQVTIMYELNHVIRALYLGTALPSAEDLEIFPRYIGYASPRWEDDTLVIESAGFHADTYIDATGVPHSEQLRTVERIRRVDQNTLETVVTVTDPAIFAQPWEARFEYKLQPGERIRDYNCGESFRDISDIPGVTEARRARGQ